MENKMNNLAEELYGEFGYDTCSYWEKQEILKELENNYEKYTTK